MLISTNVDEHHEQTRVNIPVPSATAITCVMLIATRKEPTHEDTPINHYVIHTSHNLVTGDPGLAQSSSGNVNSAEPIQVNYPPYHLRRWTKDHPLDKQRLQVSQSPGGIFINQAKYALETLKKYGMDLSDPVDTPMVDRLKLDEDLMGIPVDQTRFRGMISAKPYQKALLKLSNVTWRCGSFWMSRFKKKYVGKVLSFLRDKIGPALSTPKHDDIRTISSRASGKIEWLKLYFVEYELTTADILTKYNQEEQERLLAVTNSDTQFCKCYEESSLKLMLIKQSFYRKSYSRYPNIFSHTKATKASLKNPKKKSKLLSSSLMDGFPVGPPVDRRTIRDPVSEATPKLHEVVGKGKAVVTEEQVAHSLVDLSKKKRTTDQFIFVRRDQTPPDSTTGPSSQPEDYTSEKEIHESSSTSDSERTESDTETAAPKDDKDQMS
ncbi:hypothetical protein Tco_1236466 [Tanacetum coccineum]